jgi:lipopolysaccharide/colanic/teichoic acid biosynthesis glycosyltransferase
LAIVGLCVKLDSDGPVLFRQRRIGRHFRPFTIFKFRTMTHNDGTGQPLLTSRQDARITRVGAVLRRTKLDELPQLFNVLNGDMSIVGPRPEVAKYVELFREDYRYILELRPGITDPASLRYRDESSVLGDGPDAEAVYVSQVLPEKLRLAREYVQSSSLPLDISLIVRTLLSLVSRQTA